MTLLDDSHMTDPGLVTEVRLGRREAFGELYRRHYSSALRYALSMTRGDEARAQDIVSEAFTKVFRAMSRDGNVSAFWPYLLASVRNAHRAELRRSGRVDLVERADDLDGLLPGAPSEAEHDAPDVRAAFRRLPPRWQAVLWRTEICGDTAAEIGHDLGITANAVAALACRAREGLRVEYLRHRLAYAQPGCQPYTAHLAKLVRGVLGRRDRRRVEAHVRTCDECQRAVADLTALNGRMRSVLPLVLGAWPFASGQGLSSAPAGAAGSGLLGSAGVATSGAAGTAGLTGGTTGAAGLAGLSGIGAVGMTHASAVAGLAVASVVAVLGLPVQPFLGEPDDSRPAPTTVVPGDGATTSQPATTPMAPELVGSEPEPTAEEPLGEGLPAEGSTDNAPLSDTALSGETATLDGSVDASAGTEPSGALIPTETPLADPTGLDGSEDSAGGGAGSPAARPFGDGVPATGNGQGADNWPENDDGTISPGQSGGSKGQESGGPPTDWPAKPEHPVSTPPGQSAWPEEPVDPTSAGSERPGRSQEPGARAPGRHAKR